ncbi:hypothetical protein TNCV_4436741 [Trichonephila clavipes]|nr:hypothetical protein TNCV_4436741 [Trichonephila clavipes]
MRGFGSKDHWSPPWTQFYGQVIKIKVYMGRDPLEMYVIVGGVSLHVTNDVQANSITDVSPMAQVLY